MISLLAHSKTQVIKPFELSPIPQNASDYVKISNDVPKNPRDVITQSLDMIANYARHEAVFINFEKRQMMPEKYLIGSSAEKAIREIGRNSVIIEVKPISSSTTKSPCYIKTNLKSEDFLENVRTIYINLQKVVDGLKKGVKYVK